MRGGSWLNTTFVFFLFFCSAYRTPQLVSEALAVITIILEELSAYLPGNVIISNAKTV